MSKKQDHKRWRKQFNEDCLERDNHRCVFCNAPENLDVHHITNRKKMPNGGYVKSNGITVCDTHHLMCENYKQYQNYYYSPSNLYNMIGSSYEKAYNDSLNLK